MDKRNEKESDGDREYPVIFYTQSFTNLSNILYVMWNRIKKITASERFIPTTRFIKMLNAFFKEKKICQIFGIFAKTLSLLIPHRKE